MADESFRGIERRFSVLGLGTWDLGLGTRH